MSLAKLEIASTFQPIVSLAHQAPVGYEALLRASIDGHPVTPVEAFCFARMHDRLAEFERACVVHHVAAFARASDRSEVLFVNVHPEVIADARNGEALIADLLAVTQDPAHVVIEILETSEGKSTDLLRGVDELRRHGFLIALDDFGAGQTNLSRVWDLRPDVVKIDRELVAKAATGYRTGRSFLRLIELLHDVGTFVAVEGVETEAEALLSLDCDVDFAQGYYFGRPSPDAPRMALTVSEPQTLTQKFRGHRRMEQVADHEELVVYRRAFMDSACRYAGGAELDEASVSFLKLPNAVRTFVIDSNGEQVGYNVESEQPSLHRRAAFPLLKRLAGANWSKRAYFKNAVARPGHMVVSEPYMTSSSTNLCVTLSICMEGGGEVYVVCGDVMWESLADSIASGRAPRAA